MFVRKGYTFRCVAVKRGLKYLKQFTTRFVILRTVTNYISFKIFVNMPYRNKKKDHTSLLELILM
jgi:hypothetical protein